MNRFGDIIVKTSPCFNSEKEAIKDAKKHLGPKAKKNLAFTTYTQNKKWGWVNSKL